MSARARARSAAQAAPRRPLKMPLGLRPLEIVVAVIMIFLVILVAYYYVSTLQPENERLSALEKRDKELDRLVQEAQIKNQQPLKEDAAQMALDSLNLFKEKRLKPQMRGEIALYKDINALAKKHNLQLMSGIEMSRQGDVKEEEGKGPKKGEEMLRVYPETNIQFTVSGEYQSLRNFISQLEQNQQFLIVNSLNLIIAENDDEGGQGRRGGRGGRGGGTKPVALSIDMTTYFHP